MAKLTKYEELKHGMRVRCKIQGEQVYDCKLSIDRNGDVFVCQNKMDCNDFTEDQIGYKYASCIAFKNENLEAWFTGLTDLESVEKETKEAFKK